MSMIKLNIAEATMSMPHIIWEMLRAQKTKPKVYMVDAIPSHRAGKEK